MKKILLIILFNTYIFANNILIINSYSSTLKMLIHTNVYIDTPNTNIIGGDCTDGESAGKIAALKVIKYLTGTLMEDIPFNFKEGNKVYLNVKNLIKFGIKVEDLSLKNPILINKQNSFYDLYQKWVNIFIAFILSSIIFMIILTKKNRALKEYSKKIKDLNDTLEFKVADALKELDKQHIKHKKDTIKIQNLV